MNKKTTLIFSGILSAGFSASGAIIAGWDTFDETSAGSKTYNAPITNGVTAQAVGTSTDDGAGWGAWTNEDGRSPDGTWGTFASTTPPSTSITNSTDSVGLRNAESAGELTITLTNNSGSALDLTYFYFDGITRFNDGPGDWSLSILAGSAVTQQADFATGSVENVGSFAARAGEGYDIDLSGLADTTFEDGESVVFELAFTGGVVNSTSGGHNTMIDNMAIAAVPEPATFALVSGLLILGITCHRRNRNRKS